MNKSLMTNVVTILTIVLGYFSPVYREQILSIGFFAFSGAVTNWLAVYMLFEKVPFLYGSGVIPCRFEEFKVGIKHLIMAEFFTDENVDRFFQGQQNSAIAQIDLAPVIDAIDFNEVFTGFIEVVQQSSFGSMLNMVGGVKALEPMREPFIVKIKAKVCDLTKTEEFRKGIEDNILPSHLSAEVVKKVEEIVDHRLDELTPNMVKEIIQDMIRKHLGWLVVWGGVFGGLIGLAMSFVN